MHRNRHYRLTFTIPRPVPRLLVKNGEDSYEVDEFEDYIDTNSESSHTMNSLQGTVTSSLTRLTGALGDCNDTGTVTLTSEGVVTFDLGDNPPEDYTLKFAADDRGGMHVRYDFGSNYQVTSSIGLSSMTSGSNYVDGVRIPGEPMIIEFEKSGEGGLPGFGLLLSITAALGAALIATRRE